MKESFAGLVYGKGEAVSAEVLMVRGFRDDRPTCMPSVDAADHGSDDVGRTT